MVLDSKTKQTNEMETCSFMFVTQATYSRMLCDRVTNIPGQSGERSPIQNWRRNNKTKQGYVKLILFISFYLYRLKWLHNELATRRGKYPNPKDERRVLLTRGASPKDESEASAPVQQPLEPGYVEDDAVRTDQ